MNKLAKAVRVMTIPPILAFIVATVFISTNSLALGGLRQYIAMIVFLTLFPALAYPLQPLLPKYKDKGREGQRELAFIASVAGYMCGVAFALASRAPATAQLMYWTYMASVVFLSAFNAFTPWKASGHACGVAGPICALVWLYGARAWPAVAVFFLMAWSSLKLKRHGALEIALGSLASISAFCLVLSIITRVQPHSLAMAIAALAFLQ
ncbi:MAG: hypothetical protein FWG30_07055 [Eubacteriaceae bacterium]|nr:hypothetical protein [Eubacteriaceae bacterium]